MDDAFAITHDLVRRLAEAQVGGGFRFLLIGGYGLEAHSIVRDTQDIDFLVATASVPLVERLLADSGYVRQNLSHLCGRYAHPAPEAIPVDLLLVNESTMDKLWDDKVPHRFAGQSVFAPSVSSYIALKLHAIKWNPTRFGKDAGDIVRLMQESSSPLTLDVLRDLCDRFGPPDAFEKLRILLS